MFDTISTAEFDPRLQRKSRQTEIDSMNQLDVYRKRPRQWASSIPIISTKWMSEGPAKQLEYHSRLCEKELKGSSSLVTCVTFDMMSRKIMLLDASATCWMAGATSEVASELHSDEQAVCQDLLGELSGSLSGMREELRNGEKKWQQVFVNHKPKSSTFVCCQERELCGFVHDRFIVKSDLVQLTCIESRLKEKLDFERRAGFGLDDKKR